MTLSQAITSGSVGLQELIFLIVPLGLALLLVAFALSGSGDRKRLITQPPGAGAGFSQPPSGMQAAPTKQSGLPPPGQSKAGGSTELTIHKVEGSYVATNI